MKTIQTIIEKNNDDFWGYSQNGKSIVGGGETGEDCKQDILDCIDTLKELKSCPKSLMSEYKLEYQFDSSC